MLPLPVHGFVLAGGRSSRMGTDKALLHFRGRPMIELAVARLQNFCPHVSIIGDRADLRAFAPVVSGERPGLGPAAAIESGLRSCVHPWAIFTPVDVPLVPADLLRTWAANITAPSRRSPVGAMLHTAASPQPAFVMLSPELLPFWSAQLDASEQRLRSLYSAVEQQWGPGSFVHVPAGQLTSAAPAEIDRWFGNLNTPAELRAAELVQ